MMRTNATVIRVDSTAVKYDAADLDHRIPASYPLLTISYSVRDGKHEHEIQSMAMDDGDVRGGHVPHGSALASRRRPRRR